MAGKIEIISENESAVLYLNAEGRYTVYDKIAGRSTANQGFVAAMVVYENLSGTWNKRNEKRLLEKARVEATYGGW